MMRARWQNGVLRPLTNSMPDLDEGEIVTVEIERGRSGASHRHQFAWLRDAWASIPEAEQDQPWAETPETLRKHALIACGFHRTYTLDCGKEATAQRIKVQLVQAEAKAEGYAIGRVRGPVVTIWTPESQSVRAMGGQRFNESKAAILDWIAAKIGTSPEALTQARAA
jgi:predicted DNA-binding antitoxin AbrB/MazE fold protein